MPGKLTPREIERVQLVGARLTNAEIAIRLDLPLNRVAKTLQKAYGKLGVHDRQSAARALANRYPGLSLPLATHPFVQANQPVAAEPSGLSDAGLKPERGGLYRVYRNLENWRLPPRVMGGRIIPIVVFALFLVLTAGVVSQAFRSCVEFADTVRGRPVLTSTGDPRANTR